MKRTSRDLELGVRPRLGMKTPSMLRPEMYSVSLPFSEPTYVWKSLNVNLVQTFHMTEFLYTFRLLELKGMKKKKNLLSFFFFYSKMSL